MCTECHIDTENHLPRFPCVCPHLYGIEFTDNVGGCQTKVSVPGSLCDDCQYITNTTDVTNPGAGIVFCGCSCAVCTLWSDSDEYSQDYDDLYHQILDENNNRHDQLTGPDNDPDPQPSQNEQGLSTDNYDSNNCSYESQFNYLCYKMHVKPLPLKNANLVLIFEMGGMIIETIMNQMHSGILKTAKDSFTGLGLTPLVISTFADRLVDTLWTQQQVNIMITCNALQVSMHQNDLIDMPPRCIPDTLVYGYLL